MANPFVRDCHKFITFIKKLPKRVIAVKSIEKA